MNCVLRLLPSVVLKVVAPVTDTDSLTLKVRVVVPKHPEQTVDPSTEKESLA